MKNARKSARVLFILWVASLMVFNLGSSIYTSYQQALVGYDPIAFLSGFQLITFGIVTLYFIPLLYAVNYLAKQSGSEKLHRITSWLLVLSIVWDILMLISTTLAYVAPDFFKAITSISN